MNFIPPREVKLSLFFFKSLAGIGVGIVGLVVLAIFLFPALGVASGGESSSGPFLTFGTVVMGFITALTTNCLGVSLFDLIDREKYADIRDILKNVILLNILIFVFILPIYAFTIVTTSKNMQSVMLVATIQLVISALASIFILEMSKTQSARENLIAIYGIIFAILTTIFANIAFFQFGQSVSSAADLATGSGGGKGLTVVLFAILPTMWLFFGAFTSMVEMIYRWFYQTWGKDF